MRVEDELANDDHDNDMENALDRDDTEHTLGGIHHIVLLHNNEHFCHPTNVLVTLLALHKHMVNIYFSKLADVINEHTIDQAMVDASAFFTLKGTTL